MERRPGAAHIGTYPRLSRNSVIQPFCVLATEMEFHDYETVVTWVWLHIETQNSNEDAGREELLERHQGGPAARPVETEKY